MTAYRATQLVVTCPAMLDMTDTLLRVMRGKTKADIKVKPINTKNLSALVLSSTAPDSLDAVVIFRVSYTVGKEGVHYVAAFFAIVQPFSRTTFYQDIINLLS